MLTRFRDLPDSQMKHIVDYVEAGRPIVGLRTATHAFELKTSPTYRRYSWNSKEWDGGFGRQVLGETWINHHGRHKVQSTRGIFAAGQEKPSDPAGNPERRDLGTDGCVHGPAAAAGCAAAGARRGVGIDGPGERAGRRETERADDAGGMDQIVQGRPDLHDHDGLGAGPGERGFPPPGGECVLLGARDGARIPARAKVDLVGPYVPVAVRIRRISEGATAGRLADRPSVNSILVPSGSVRNAILRPAELRHLAVRHVERDSLRPGAFCRTLRGSSLRSRCDRARVLCWAPEPCPTCAY